MNRIKNRLAEQFKPQLSTEEKKEYDSEKNLNWRDDGNELNDPSINDYLKGYQIEPYEFKQWAKIKGIGLTKVADQEAVVMKFTPDFLGDRILTLWNGADGQLQNFFESFTLRYNNNLKLQIAGYLESQGYKVYPFLTDDKPRYARVQAVFKKVVASKNLDNIMAFATEAFRSCDGFMLFAGELADLKEAGEPITTDDASGMLEYYKQIYPSDYAISLVNIVIDDPEKAEEEFGKNQDYNLSDESLNRIEDYMSGNADPFGSNKGGSPGGYDFTSDMRGTDGTAPGLYELRASKKKS